MIEERPDALEQIQEEFLASLDEDPTRLGEWLRRFPQHARELTDLALHHARVELAPDPEPDPLEEEAFLARGMDIVRGILQERSAAAKPPLEDLFAEASARGLNPHGLARALRLSVPTITRLHRRLIRYASIPGQLVHELAHLLEREVSSVVAYLQRPPALAAGANHRSEAAPVVGQAEEFADVIRADENLSEGDRTYWLRQAESGGPAE